MDLQQYYQTGAYRNEPKPTAPAPSLVPKRIDEAEERGSGGNRPGYLNQVIQGPQWGSENNQKATERRLMNPFNATAGMNLNGQSTVTHQSPFTNKSPQGIGYSSATHGSPSGGFESPAMAKYPIYDNQGNIIGYSSATQGSPYGGERTLASTINPIMEDTGQRAASPELPPQANGKPPWLTTNGGSPFLPGDMPIWTPSDWVNPSNPLPQEVVSPELNLAAGAGTGVDTGLLASIMANDTSTNPPMPVNQIAAYLQEHRNKVTVPGWDARQQDYWTNQTMSPQAVAQQNAYAPNSFTGPNGQVVGQNAGLSPWQAQNAGYQGLTNQVIAPQGNYAPNSFTGPNGQVAGQPTSAPLSPVTGLPVTPNGTNGTVGAGKDATGKEIDPWVQVQDPTTGVLHPRGLSLEEVTNTGAGNLKKGFDYRNNPGFKGQTVTLPDGTVLPQIAGYYITNGRYYPIDLNAVSTLFKKFSYGGGGGGGGGGGYTQRSGQNGWLANWNIGV